MNTSPGTKTKVNLGVKIFDCLFSMTGLLMVIYFLNGTIPAIAMPVLGIIIIASAIILLITWNYHATNNKFPHAKVHAWLLGVIRYTLAYTVSVYGFAKVFKTQFSTVYSRNDVLVGNLSGFDLTWQYFGYSYKLALILAALQIGGSVLLLFRRTTLLGICVLLPVMVNIVLINMFYHIAVGAFFVSILITTGLIYLLVLYREPLIKLFFYADASLPLLQLSYFKYVIRIAVIAIAFFTIYRYIKDAKSVEFTGKWKVEKMERNGKPVADNAWTTDTTAWKNIYVEEQGMAFFSPNPYLFEATLSTRVSYKYDKKAHTLKLIILKGFKPTDSMVVTVNQTDKRNMEWISTSKSNNFKLWLSKEQTPMH